jgi:CheY-like chemotaxis protein
VSEEFPAAEPVSILIVDDQPGNLLSLKGVLERPDSDLVLAHDGPEALSHVLRREFAVILLDVAMPGMDGFEVASIIKQRVSCVDSKPGEGSTFVVELPRKAEPR